MIKKLKVKFILNNMLLVSIVIISIFSALGGFIYVTEENKINTALTNNIKFAQSVLPIIPNKPSEHNDLVYDVSLVMLIDNNGKVLQSTNTDLSDSTIEKIVEKLLKKDSEKGLIRDMNLSYSKTQKNGSFHHYYDINKPQNQAKFYPKKSCQTEVLGHFLCTFYKQ